MAKLSKEERADLQRRLDEDDQADDDFEIEIEDNGKRARVPYSKGRSWLQEVFGIDLPAEPAEDAGETEPQKPKDKPAAGGEVRRFGRRVG